MAAARDEPPTFVFSARSGDRYRAGRTLRALTAFHISAENICDLASPNLAQKFLECAGAAWFVRAGAWPLHGAPHFPRASHTGRPLCALGLRLAEEGAASSADDEPRRWAELQAQCGGDFSALPDLASRMPPPVSVYLERPLLENLARRLAGGETISAALTAVVCAANARLIRFPALDVCDDPALRVAQVITSLQQGGAERVALDLAHELPARGIRPLLITLGNPTRAAFTAPAGTISVADAGTREARIAAAVVAAQKFHADLVHAHLLNGEDVPAIRAASLPLIMTIHNARAGWPTGVESLRAGDAALLVACSRAVEADLRFARLPISTRTAWNGIDFVPLERTPKLLAAGKAFRAALEFSPDDYLLLALANPRPQKRLELLPVVLAATQAEFIRKEIPCRVRLVIAGEASRVSDEAARAVDALQSEIVRLRLDADVRLIGAAADVAPVLAACDALVSMSAFEGLSLAHLEALAAGLPVIATDAGGTVEIAKDNPAFSLIPLDAIPEIVAEKIAGCALKSDIFTGRVAASIHFTRERMAEQYARLYPRAISAANGATGSAAALSGLASVVGHPPTEPVGLLLIANNFSTGGAQFSARRLLLGLAAEGVRVRAAVLQEQPEFPTPGRRALLDAGIPVLALPPAGSLDPAIAVAQLLEHIDADPPRAVLLWNVIAEYKVLLADALLETPLFDISPGEMNFSSLEKYFERPRPGLPYRTSADYGARLAGAIVKYEAEAGQARELLQTTVRVIPNGVPITEAVPERAPSDRLVIGTAARISPQKKLEELIEALRLASCRLPPHVLRIAGGVEQGSEDYFERLKIQSSGLAIEWVGECESTVPFLRELDIFAMISEPAGCPNASLEAMAAALPVIATDVGGAREQIEDGVTGRIVPRGDVSAFADALVDLASDPARQKRWGAAALERARSLFDQKRMVADYRRVCGV